MPKISIIVPIYKAEAVLAKCVDSVLAQTCSDWELLLIVRRLRRSGRPGPGLP